MFGFIVDFFNFFLYYPLFNSLVVIYNYLPGHDFGLAIIVLTILIKVILYPVSVRAINSQKALQKLQPKLQEIQKKYKDDKEKQAKEQLELYRTEKINPFSGLLLAVAQFPILIALYRVFWNGLKPEELSHLYNFVSNPVSINTIFFGLIDLSKPNLIFAILAGILQYFQTKMMMPDSGRGQIKAKDMASMMQKQMLYFFPILTVVILLSLPSALGLYWTVSSLFSILQYIILNKKEKKSV